MSVRPYAKLLYTKTQERVKIIDCVFVLFERCIPGIENATRTHEYLIFNDFAICWEPIDEIDSNFSYLKGMD